MVQGIRRSKFLSEVDVQVLEKLTGEQTLIYQDETVKSRRGILMGHNTSWCMLNLMHLVWIQWAIKGNQGEWNRVRICGDDLIANWKRLTIDRYHDILRRSGGVTSPKKHLVCENHGVFCEEKFQMTLDSQGRRRAIFSSSFSIASLTSECKRKTTKEDAGTETNWISIAVEARSLAR